VIVKRLVGAPGLRRLAATPPAHRAAGAYTRSGVLHERARFMFRELNGSRMLATYRLRSSSVRICVRHSTPDLYTLDQVFVQRLFEIPEPAACVLEPYSEDLRAVDLGANIGLFGADLLSRFPRADIVAFEPDPSNAKVLACCIAANGRSGSWRLVEACAATSDGLVSFVPGEYGISHIAAPGEAGAIDVEALDVFPHLSEAQLIKIDIEGAEWALLGDPRFGELPAAAIHLEYHARQCPGPDSRSYATEALERAGFSWCPVLHSSEGNGIVWAWRT